MAQWFQGGLRRMNDIAAAWQNANLFASVVDGPSATISNEYTTLKNFIDGGNSLMSDAKNLPLTGDYVRLIGWEGSPAVTRTLRIQVNAGQGVTFTAPAAGQNCNGILIHEETDVDPLASYVWGFEPRVGDPVTKGGDIVWGNQNENIPLKYQPVSGVTCETGRSSVELIRGNADYWGNNDARIGFSLVRDTGTTVFNPLWESLADASTVQFCTGTEPSKDTVTSNSPKLTVTDRVVPGDYVDPWVTYPLQNNTEVEFDSTKDGWTQGENAIAVLTYMFLETPAWDPALVRIWAWDNIAPYSLQNGRNLIYGGRAGEGNKNTLNVAIT